VQPIASDLCWIQIEDFVELFNRVYVINDNTVKLKEGVSKRFVSKWLPGDFIGGSGGPPILIAARTPAPVDTMKSTDKDISSGDDADNKVKGGQESEHKSNRIPAVADEPERYAYINDSFTNNPMYPFSVNEKATLSITLFQSDKRWNESRLGDEVRDVLLKTFVSRCVVYSCS